MKKSKCFGKEWSEKNNTQLLAKQINKSRKEEDTEKFAVHRFSQSHLRRDSKVTHTDIYYSIVEKSRERENWKFLLKGITERTIKCEWVCVCVCAENGMNAQLFADMNSNKIN